MSTAVLLLRFDDICPTMNWQVWEEIERVLVRQEIRPIVAVVPDNRDPRLVVAQARPDFWDRVRQWQSWGWTVALHGYQHVYVNRNPGLVGITPQSEFAGLPRAEQEAKLRAGLSVFKDQGLVTETWVAPSHSFDAATLDLLRIFGIRVISDGFTTRHFIDRHGMIWVPCQQWDRFRPKPAGVWTVCIHHNRWSRQTLERFRQDIEAHHMRIGSIPQLLASDPPTPLRAGERVVAWGSVMWTFRLRRAAKRLVRWEAR